MERSLALCSALLLTACGGGGGAGTLPALSSAVAPASATAQWTASLRYTPTVVTESLGAPQLGYAYVDAGSVNGKYPNAAWFQEQFDGANPALLTGSCSSIATMSESLITPNAYSGQQYPTVVIAFYPRVVGTCTEAVNLGLSGASSISLTVGS